jgi:ABC-type transport system substrate-binding protein
MRIIRAICLAICVALACMGASATDLRIGVASEVTTLDPHFFHLTSNTEIHKGIYSGLVTQDADMKVVPDLAVSWRTIDATHWEFKLRPGVTFHDGTPLTADDVVFTYQRARNVPNSPGSFLQYLKHVTQTVAADPLTVVVETGGPDPILLNELQNVWIVSRKNGTGATTADYNSGKAAIGTGPYRLAEWVPGDHITLSRFDGYYGTKSRDHQRRRPHRRPAERRCRSDRVGAGQRSGQRARQSVADRLHHAGQPLLLLDPRRRSRRLTSGNGCRRQADVEESAEGCAGAARDVEGARS